MNFTGTLEVFKIVITKQKMNNDNMNSGTAWLHQVVQGFLDISQVLLHKNNKALPDLPIL